MRTVVLGDRPPELEALIARRHAMGQDVHDEVWHGEYHMAPLAHGWHGDVQMQLGIVLSRLGRPLGLVASGPVNLGEEGNFRAPDVALHRGRPNDLWFRTAAMVVEVVSPHDESWLKFDHYAAHDVDEVLVADPQAGTLHLFVLVGGAYEPAERSGLLDVTLAELHAAVDWPRLG